MEAIVLLLLGAVFCFVLGFVLRAIIELVMFLVVGLPRRLLERFYSLLGWEKPKNLRAWNGVTGITAAIVSLLSYVAVQEINGEKHEILTGILNAFCGLNLLVALVGCWQFVFNEQYEERAVHKYKCPLCRTTLRLSSLPVSGSFRCSHCSRPLRLSWEYGNDAAIISPDFEAFGLPRPSLSFPSEERTRPHIKYGYHIFSGSSGYRPVWLASATGAKFASELMKTMSQQNPGRYFIRFECELEEIESINTTFLLHLPKD
jgi:hypothetical protein